MIQKNKKAFTLIELLVVMVIIAILMSVVLTLWINSALKRSSVASYKHSMKSTQTAAELCFGGGYMVRPGTEGDKICDTDNDGDADEFDIGKEYYPIMNSKCGATKSYTISGTVTNWVITTDSSCRGCLLSCTPEKCDHIENPVGSCDPK